MSDMLLQSCDSCGSPSPHLTPTTVSLGEGSCAVKDLCDHCKLIVRTAVVNETNLLRG
jgi:ribosomal protein L36